MEGYGLCIGLDDFRQPATPTAWGRSDCSLAGEEDQVTKVLFVAPRQAFNLCSEGSAPLQGRIVTFSSATNIRIWQLFMILGALPNY